MSDTPDPRSGLTRRTLAGAAVGTLGAAAAFGGSDPAVAAEQPFRALARNHIETAPTSW